MKDIASYNATLCTALIQALESLKIRTGSANAGLVRCAAASVTSIISTNPNNNIFATVVDAILGSNYFLVRDLLKVLDIGDAKVGLPPLFGSKVTPVLLPCILTHDHLVIHSFSHFCSFQVFR